MFAFILEKFGKIKTDLTMRLVLRSHRYAVATGGAAYLLLRRFKQS